MIDTSGTWSKGFDLAQAFNLLELCVNLNNPGVYACDTGAWSAVLPGTPDDPVTVLGPWDNAWKLWRLNDTSQGETFAIVIRGTIGAKPSIIEDVITTSISAQSAIIKAWDDGYLSFRLAGNDRAESHLGFTYGLAVLLFANEHGILSSLKTHVPAGSKLLITGHSQGAAVATLLHAFLHYAINDPDDRYGLRDRGHSLKSYVFAQPKPGNVAFAMDFARIAASQGTAFTINNSRDFVTEVPLSLESLEEPGDDLMAQLDAGHASIALKGAFKLFRHGLLAAQDVRAVVSRACERITEAPLQAWNSPVSQMDETYKSTVVPTIPEAASTNFTTVGALIPVFGDPPGTPGVVAGDPLYHHHLPTYRGLMQGQL